ncbi:MAG: hypothetical protein L0Y74_10510 [candidate division Zixibacteria bacterium]|nr:hypothetical protein [candidate division Zixibacteria bacterium]
MKLSKHGIVLLVILSAAMIFTVSCDREAAVNRMMENEQIVSNIMERLWADSLRRVEFVNLVLADEASYNKIIDSTLMDSTMFAGLVLKVAADTTLKRQVITLAEEWKKQGKPKR